MDKNIMDKVFVVDKITVGQYMADVADGDVSVNQAVQREFNWTDESVSGLVYSAVSNTIYISNIILAQEKKENGTTKTYVVDGGNRTLALKKFACDGFRTSKKMEKYLIPYERKMKDDEGNYVYDENGEIVKEIAMFDLRGKTFKELPVDLQKRFKKCPLSVTTYLDSTEENTSELVRIYNNHVGMNASQKAFTYLGKYANEIKRIRSSNDFLKDGTALSENEKKKGVWERVIAECVMAVNHFDVWKKAPKNICEYLNNNSSDIELKNMEDYFNRLAPFSDKMVNKEVSDLFVSKNMCIWMIVFDKFLQFGLPDEKFGEFLESFAKELKDVEVNGVDWVTLDTDRHTKDKSTITAKVEHLMYLMKEFLHVEEKEMSEDVDTNEEINEEDMQNEDASTEEVSKNEENSNIETVEENHVPTADEIEDNHILAFAQVEVDPGIDADDVEMYKEFLDDYVRDGSHVKTVGNAVLVAMLAYAYKIDKDTELSEWLDEISKRNDKYSQNDHVNFTYFKRDFDKYLDCLVAHAVA